MLIHRWAHQRGHSRAFKPLQPNLVSLTRQFDHPPSSTYYLVGSLSMLLRDPIMAMSLSHRFWLWWWKWHWRILEFPQLFSRMSPSPPQSLHHLHHLSPIGQPGVQFEFFWPTERTTEGDEALIQDPLRWNAAWNQYPGDDIFFLVILTVVRLIEFSRNLRESRQDCLQV